MLIPIHMHCRLPSLAQQHEGGQCFIAYHPLTGHKGGPDGVVPWTAPTASLHTESGPACECRWEQNLIDCEGMTYTASTLLKGTSTLLRRL